MTVLQRKELESSPLADLHAIASELGLEGYRRLRKAQLLDAILGSPGEEGGGARRCVGGAPRRSSSMPSSARRARTAAPPTSRPTTLRPRLKPRPTPARLTRTSQTR